MWDWKGYDVLQDFNDDDEKDLDDLVPTQEELEALQEELDKQRHSQDILTKKGFMNSSFVYKRQSEFTLNNLEPSIREAYYEELEYRYESN